MTEDDPLSTVKGFCWGLPLATVIWCVFALIVGLSHV